MFSLKFLSPFYLHSIVTTNPSHYYPTLQGRTSQKCAQIVQPCLPVKPPVLRAKLGSRHRWITLCSKSMQFSHQLNFMYGENPYLRMIIFTTFGIFKLHLSPCDVVRSCLLFSHNSTISHPSALLCV